MPLEVPTICPGSPDLPRISEQAGTFYLAPPLRHTRDRLYVALGDAGWRIHFPADGVLAVEVEPEGLHRLLPALAAEMSDPEMDAAPAMFMEEGEAFGPASLFQARALSVWSSRAEHAWLLQLIQDEQVRIHYQPIVPAGEVGTAFAHECLVRGVDAHGQTVSPGRLFKAAELAELEFHLDRLARVAAIRDSYSLGIDTPLFINFRPTAIYDPAFCLRTTVGAAERLGVDPQRIVFEVVESEAVSDHAHLRHIVDEYRRGGFRIALDDLGAGYGSLNRLKDLEPDFVKIDRELIRQVHANPGQRTIVAAILGMARDLGITTVAEGVEEREEYEWLLQAGADLLQGFYFARPASPPPALGSRA